MLPNPEPEKQKLCKIIITIKQKETWFQSVANDITTISLLTGLVWLNEVTLHSTTLNFLFGLTGLIMLLGYAAKVVDDNSIKGTDVEEIITKLRKRLAEIE